MSHTSARPYVVAWLALLLLTAISYAVSRIHFGAGDAIVALTIASIKTTIVLLVFMHLREARYSWRMVPVIALLLVMIFVVLTAADPLTRMK